jgi:acyl-coenzyme A thioesterase PaaI-like protein
MLLFGQAKAPQTSFTTEHRFIIMHVTELAINKTLGMQLAPQGTGHILEMPESPLLLNHIGTVHASAQFALAEASSGEFLLCHLRAAQNQVFAVLRTSDVKFRKPAHGALRASARFAEGSAESLSAELSSRGRTLASVLVEVADSQGIVTMSGQYDWFLQRQTNAA